MTYTQEELESLLIGSILTKSTNTVVASKYIKDDDLMFPASVACFKAACELQRKSEPVNIQSVCMAAGAEYSSYLAKALDEGMSSNCERIAKEIAECASKRRISMAARSIFQNIESAPLEVTLHDLPFIISDVMESNDFHHIKLLDCAIHSSLNLDSTVSILVEIEGEKYRAV